jgi:hypothetical protein
VGDIHPPEKGNHNMNDLNVEKAWNVFSRFHEDHPNLSSQEYTAKILSITKRFGITSVLLLAFAKKERDALIAEIAAKSDPTNEGIETPIGAIEQLFLAVLVGNWEGLPPLTNRQRKFFSAMKFGLDEKKGEFFISDARRQRLSVPSR